MFEVPECEKNRPPRTMWASDVRERLGEIHEKIEVLKAEDLQVRQSCNHTYPDGSSAIKRHYDDHFGWGDTCDVCRT